MNSKVAKKLKGFNITKAQYKAMTAEQRAVINRMAGVGVKRTELHFHPGSALTEAVQVMAQQVERRVDTEIIEGSARGVDKSGAKPQPKILSTHAERLLNDLAKIKK